MVSGIGRRDPSVLTPGAARLLGTGGVKSSAQALPQKNVLQGQFSDPIGIRLAGDDFFCNAPGQGASDFVGSRRVVGPPSVSLQRG